jgi:hypothetical protein
MVLISLQIGLLASYADPVRLQSKIESTIGRPHQTIRKEHLAEFLPLAWTCRFAPRSMLSIGLSASR